MTSSDSPPSSPPSSPPVLSPQETRSKSALSQSANGTITTSSSPQATDSGKRDVTGAQTGSETAQATVTAAQSDNDDDDDVMIVAPAAERDNDNDSCSGSSNALDRVHRVKIGQSDVTVQFPVKLHAKFDHG